MTNCTDVCSLARRGRRQNSLSVFVTSILSPKLKLAGHLLDSLMREKRVDICELTKVSRD